MLLIKNIRRVFFNNYIAIQVVNKQFGLKNNNNLLPVVVVDFAWVALMFETPVLLESGEIPRSLWMPYKLKIESYMHFQMICLMICL